MIEFNDMEPWDEPDTLCHVFQRCGYKTYSVGKRQLIVISISINA